MVIKSKSALHHVPILHPCKSGWSLPISSWDMVHTNTFWLKFGSLSPTVTLKIRSRSPKPNQLFIMSQCYTHANLVKIHPPVHGISSKQRKCHADADANANANVNANANRIRTKNNMSPSPSVGDIINVPSGYGLSHVMRKPTFVGSRSLTDHLFFLCQIFFLITIFIRVIDLFIFI